MDITVRVPTRQLTRLHLKGRYVQVQSRIIFSMNIRTRIAGENRARTGSLVLSYRKSTPSPLRIYIGYLIFLA